MKKIQHFAPDGTCRPKIDYPCSWQYKIFGESAQAIQEVVETALIGRTFALTLSNVSRGGRYVSMNLELMVFTEEERLELYRIIAAHPAVKVVL